MKKILFILILAASYKISLAQGTTDPFAPPTVTNGNQLPTQSGPPYDGTQQSGAPNTSYTLTEPSPTGNVPNTNPAINYTDPTNPASASYSIPPSTLQNTNSPGVSSPGVISSPGTPTTNTQPQINRLFQDPARTPKNPGKTGSIGNANGSSGKYKSDHPVHNSKGFAKHNKHIKKAPEHKEKESYENTKATPKKNNYL